MPFSRLINIARDSINARNYSTQINLLRTIYQVDRLEMDNQSERSRLLFYSIIGCILILGISIVSVLYIRKINARLIASQHKLEKARQSAENSIRTKSLFLSNMSHEIRTPLNALSGFSSILTDANIDIGTRQQCNEIIQQNSDLLLKLIDDVVDLSVWKSGKCNSVWKQRCSSYLSQCSGYGREDKANIRHSPIPNVSGKNGNLYG